MVPSEAPSPATPLLPGTATGAVLKLTETLNLWGGVDPSTGTIVHHGHPQRGLSMAGRVLVLPETRGSGTNAQVLAQALAQGHGPAAVVLGARDHVLCAGAAVAAELYAVHCPIVLVEPDLYEALQPGMVVRVDADDDIAAVTWERAPS